MVLKSPYKTFFRMAPRRFHIQDSEDQTSTTPEPTIEMVTPKPTRRSEVDRKVSFTKAEVTTTPTTPMVSFLL